MTKINAIKPRTRTKTMNKKKMHDQQRPQIGSQMIVHLK